jgi:hypothetical protein
VKVGEPEYSALLKIRKLQKNRNAKPQERANCVQTGTYLSATFSGRSRIPEQDLPSPATASSFHLTLVVAFIQFAHRRFQCELRFSDTQNASARGADFGC